MSNQYIVVRDNNHVRISEVLNDCALSLCVTTYKNEPLSSILKKMCARIEECCAANDDDDGGGQIFIQGGDNIEITGSGTEEDPYVVDLDEDVNFTLFTLDSPTIDFSGDGSVGDPLTGDVVASQAPGNSIMILPDGIYSANPVQAGIVYGGIVTWIDDYNYHVSAAGYWINFQFYESPAADFTLSVPDGTFNRLDTFVLDITGVAVVLEGTPSVNPAQAPLDPASQLEISIALVEVGTTEPTMSAECIFRNNVEWTATPNNAIRLNPDSTNIPCNGTKTLEATSLVNGDNILFDRGSVITPTTLHTQLDFYIRSKAAFGTNSFTLQWELGGVPVGNGIIIGQNSFGFDSTDTVTCQLIAIPLFAFGLNSLGVVDGLRITASVTGGTFGFYIDDLCIQGQAVPDFPTSPDVFFKISATDSTSGYFSDKFLAGTNVLFTVNNPGANETITIDVPSLDTLTFDNGLTRTLDNVQWGGTLLADTTITGNTFKSIFNTAVIDGTGGVMINQTGPASAIYATADDLNATGVFVNSSTGWAVEGVSEDTAIYAATINANQDDTYAVLQLNRGTTGTAQSNMGVSMEMWMDTNSSNRFASSIETLWTDEFDGIETSHMDFYVTVGGVKHEVMQMDGGGVTLFDYGAGSQPELGTATYFLVVDAAGNVLELDINSLTALTFDNGLTETAGNVQLGGTLIIPVTTIAAGTNTLDITTTNTGLFEFAFGTFIASNAANAVVIQASTTDGIAGVFDVNPATTNTVVNSISVRRTTSGTAANNIGVGLQFVVENDIGSAVNTNQFVSQLTNVISGSETTRFILRGLSSGVNLDALTIAGTGATRLNQYGIGTFTGTPAYILATEADGDVIEVDAATLSLATLTSLTADNGLNKSSATNVQLGGTLLANTTINTGGFTTIWTGSNDSETSFTVANTGATSANAISGTATGTTSVGVIGTSTAYLGVYGVSTSNNGVQGESTSGTGVVGASSTGVAFSGQINPVATNTVANVMVLRRTTSSGAGANGIGGAIQFELETATSGLSQTAGVLSYKWTDATNATRTSQLIVAGVNSTANNDIAAFDGTGVVGIGIGSAFTGTRLNIVDNAVAGANIVSITSTSTAAAGSLQRGLSIDLSGANANAAQTSSGIYVVNSHSNASGQNYGGNFSATGAGGISNTGVFGTGSTIGVQGTSANVGVYGTGTGSGIGVQGQSTSGFGLSALSTSGVGGYLESTSSNALTALTNPASTNSVTTVGIFSRRTSGTAANGIGGSIDFTVENSDASTNTANQITSKWTNATVGTRTSQLAITGVNSAAAAADIAAFDGTGVVGIGISSSFTATRLNVVDNALTSGSMAVFSSTSTVAASGHKLVAIAASGANPTPSLQTIGLDVSNSRSGTTTQNYGIKVAVTNGGSGSVAIESSITGSGNGIVSSAVSGTSIYSTSTDGVGAYLRSTNNSGVAVQSDPATTNSVHTVATLTRTTTGTAANGIGNALLFTTQTTSGSGSPKSSTMLVSKWLDATDATRLAEFAIRVTDGIDTDDRITVSGTGAVRFNQYGINTFAGAAAYVLGVDVNGNVIEVAAAGAGMTNPMSATGDIIYSSGGATPAALAIGTIGQVLQVSGAGIPEWVTPGVGGTVTSVNSSFTGGIISAGGGPITTSGTLTYTVAGISGGIPYFSANNAWTSSAVLTAGALMIGGGAAVAPSTTATGTGVITALGITPGTVGSFVVNGGALGTPSSGTLTSATGLPISTGLTGAGTGILTALGINVGSAGAPVLFNGAGGTPSSIVLTNATGLPASGLTGLGTGVATALAVNVGTAGAFVVNGGALGTPASGVATNLTGTATALNIGGNAATATILQTARTINGTSFNGSANITVTAAAGTLTGATLAANVLASSLTSVGTIATGVWQGTAIADGFISSAATWNAKQAGDATLTALAGLTITNGSLIVGTGADAFSVLAAGTNGHFLSMVAGTPAWVAAGGGTVTSVSGGTTGLTFATPTTTPVMSGTLNVVNGGTGTSTIATGDIYYGSAPNVLSKLPIGIAARVLTVSGGIPSWGTVALGNASAVSGDLNFSNFAQGSARSVLGVTGNATADHASISGTANQVLRQNTAGNGVSFGQVNIASSAAVTGTLPVVNGGTGLAVATTSRIPITDGTGYVLAAPSGTNGITVVMGPGTMSVNYAFNPTLQTLVDGGVITWTVANGESARVTLGNVGRTLSIPDPVAGRTYVIEVIQDGAGNRTITTYPTGTNWGAAGAPTLSTVGGGVDVLTFYYNGTGYRAVHTWQS